MNKVSGRKRVRLRGHFELDVELGPPIRLTDVVALRAELPDGGVYLIVEHTSEEDARKADYRNPAVVYIGKANGELMSTRCQKHLWSVQDARLTNGQPRTRPGIAFKQYREKITSACRRITAWHAGASITARMQSKVVGSKMAGIRMTWPRG
ncbi:MAG: hypothetical protein ACOX1P_17200 [Thermoguttaceae bacterium]|jgi:hypothetical protein